MPQAPRKNQDQTAPRKEPSYNPQAPAPTDAPVAVAESTSALSGLGDRGLPCLALICVLVSMTAMNVAAFPSFDVVFSPARDLSVLANALALVTAGIIAACKPHLATPRIIEAATAGFLIAGAVLLAAGALCASSVIITLGACAEGIGRAGVILLSALALCSLNAPRASLAICLAYLAQYLFEPAVRMLPAEGGFALFVLLPLATLPLCRKQARSVVGQTAPTPSPLDLSVTRPTSFVAPVSTLYACLFLFHIAFGWSLRFSEASGVPTGDPLGLIPLAVIALYLTITKKNLPADILTQLSVLIVVAGFLLASSGIAGYHAAANALLSCGNTVFDMVALIVLISVASRNPVGAITVIAWGKGISGIGTIAGALLGVSMNHAMQHNPALLFAASGALLLLFVGWALIGLKRFSFREAIEGIDPVDVAEPTPAAVSPANVFDERCEQIAREFGLTPRELEVFRMLARGRDRAYIEEALVVSRNTVKAHVKHIYAKLGIHSHQELIDLVE